jgi:hypothetical protein
LTTLWSLVVAAALIMELVAPVVLELVLDCP